MMSTLLQIDSTAFRLFGWPVQWYGLIIGLGIVVAYWMVMRSTRKMGISDEIMSDIIFWTVIIGFVGARLYYVIFRWEYYGQHLDQIIQIWHGGLAIYGGVLAGAATVIYMCRRYQLDIPALLDCAAPAVLIAQAIGRWGNFINQEAHGGETTHAFLESLFLPNWLIEQMYIDGAYYHPTFLYESVWAFIGVAVLLILRRLPHFLQKGEVAALYLIWYGAGRIVIEGMRTDSLYLGSLRISQVVSSILVVVGIGYIIRKRGAK